MKLLKKYLNFLNLRAYQITDTAISDTLLFPAKNNICCNLGVPNQFNLQCFGDCPAGTANLMRYLPHSGTLPDTGLVKRNVTGINC